MNPQDLEEVRSERRYDIGEDEKEGRTQGQRDRDRILYCSAFRRLATIHTSDAISLIRVISYEEGLIKGSKMG